MKKILGKIFGGGIEQIGNVVDKFVHTGEEKEKAKREMAQVLSDIETKMEDVITQRHQIDMQSDSWLSKNIRPMIMIFSLVLYTIFSVTDGNVGNFNVSDAYVELLAQIVMLGLGFYFGGRTLEKLTNIVSNRKKKE